MFEEVKAAVITQQAKLKVAFEDVFEPELIIAIIWTIVPGMASANSSVFFEWKDASEVSVGNDVSYVGRRYVGLLVQSHLCRSHLGLGTHHMPLHDLCVARNSERIDARLDAGQYDQHLIQCLPLTELKVLGDYHHQLQYKVSNDTFQHDVCTIDERG